MSVILELSMIPMGKGEGVSQYLAQVVEMIRDSGVDYRLGPMGTTIETDSIGPALALVERAYDMLDELGCNRVYAILKFDIRKGRTNRLSQKIESVTDRIGEVNTSG